MGSWCSGLTCGPVKAEIGGSNPLEPASPNTSALICGGVLFRRATDLSPQGSASGPNGKSHPEVRASETFVAENIAAGARQHDATALQDVGLVGQDERVLDVLLH
jgi:hypothetical protein